MTLYFASGETVRTKYFDYLTPLVVLSSLSIFMLIKKGFSSPFIIKSMDWLLRFSRKDLFGIFLIHIFYIDMIPHISIVDSFIHSNAYVGIPCLTLIVFLLSLFTTKILRLVPLINKIV